MKHLMLMEMRILDLDSGVETWNVTPSKSEMIWSIEAGAAPTAKRSVRICLRRRLWYSSSSCLGGLAGSFLGAGAGRSLPWLKDWDGRRVEGVVQLRGCWRGVLVMP